MVGLDVTLRVESRSSEYKLLRIFAFAFVVVIGPFA